MKLTLTIFVASTLAANAAWFACNTAGKAVGVRYDASDAVTLSLPGPKSRPAYVAFLTTPCASLLGKTITATLHIDAPAGTIYGTSVAAPPATVRIYFTTGTAPFDYQDSTQKHPLNYWWCYASAVTCDTLDGGADVTITATVSSAGGWNASYNEQSSSTPYFTTAATNAHQVGFGFGGYNFDDTGVDANNASTVLHVTSFSVQ